MPGVMTTQPKTDITQGDQLSCLGLMACQQMTGFCNDSQSVVQRAGSTTVLSCSQTTSLLLLPEHIQPCHI